MATPTDEEVGQFILRKFKELALRADGVLKHPEHFQYKELDAEGLQVNDILRGCDWLVEQGFVTDTTIASRTRQGGREIKLTPDGEAAADKA